jgi:hypothetical protein
MAMTTFEGRHVRNRKQQREDARLKARNTAKDNSYELRSERIQRQREERELAEEQRVKRRMRLMTKRENGEDEDARGWTDCAVQKMKAWGKIQNLAGMGVEIAIVVAASVAAIVMFWLNVSIENQWLKEHKMLIKYRLRRSDMDELGQRHRGHNRNHQSGDTTKEET